jgi:superfamily II DNA or RNA helicase
MKREYLSEQDLTNLLRFAILFLRSSDDIVARLGYRIILQYSELTRDYEPLHAVAQAKNLTPIVAAIELIVPTLSATNSLQSAMQAAHNTNFMTRSADGKTVARTRGQMELRAFNAREQNAVVVAPTSYGKSEMLIDNLARALSERVCILVPSRALIAQTISLVVDDDRVREANIRVISHPDSYNSESRFIAVLTQERLQRLLVQNPELVFDKLLVDEAHNLLPDELRARELSQVIMIARYRNPGIAITYYTPFMAQPSNLRPLYEQGGLTKSKSVNEHVKSERIVVARPGETAVLYDQYLNRFIDLKKSVPDDELDAIKAVSRSRTLIYVNRPRDAQALAGRLSEAAGRRRMSPEARRAAAAISDFVDPDYELVKAIKSGVLFHHGQLPDSLRQYVEALFRNDSSSQKRLLVSTSTLLEGVNTPADCLIIMSPSRGRKHLSASGFRNLIGRVARFKEIFGLPQPSLDLLQPRIYLIPGSYSSDNWNLQTFLENVANLTKVVDDKVSNPLLDEAEPSAERQEALLYLENVEAGSSGLLNPITARTEVGRLCFQNDIHDFDILSREEALQASVDSIRATEELIQDPARLIEVIYVVFLQNSNLEENHPLARLETTQGARDFYAMFISWRTQNEPFKLILSRFVSYWSSLEDNRRVYVGSRWGEETYGELGYRRMFVNMSLKTRAEKINLAVVKIKEEQDFVDYQLMKYVEVLHGLGLFGSSFYYQVKYGTDDLVTISLLRNGFSPDLARVVIERYPEHINAHVTDNYVDVYDTLPLNMDSESENPILVFEAGTLVNKNT